MSESNQLEPLNQSQPSLPERSENSDAPTEVEQSTKTRDKAYYSKCRWFMLVLIILYVFGPYYIWANPAQLQIPLMKRFKMNQTSYSIIYAFYSLPNMCIPIFNAMVIERVGLGWGLVVTTGGIFIGQCIITAGVKLKSFGTLLAGRIFFGMFADTLWMV